MKLIKNHTEWFLFLICLLVGSITVQYYGIAWDEHLQRGIGETCYNYIFEGNNYYLSFPDRDHGVTIELPLFAIEKWLNISSTQTLFVFRHLLCHTLFLLSAVYLYKLTFELYQNKKLAILAFCFLIINPTIYSHSFFNSKDIPFLSFTIFFLYHFVKILKYSQVKNLLLLSIFTGLLTSLRIMGVMFFVFIILYFLVQLIIKIARKESTNSSIKSIILYIIISIISTIIFFPVLWISPIENFNYVLQSMSKFGWDNSILFNGNNISSKELPWYYLPEWFIISTSILYVIIGLLGIILFKIQFIKKPQLNLLNTFHLFSLAVFASPIIATIILHSVLYDGWRQVFFIYPSFVLICIYFINQLYENKFRNYSFYLAFIPIISPLIFIILNFPNQHVYFNEIVPKKDEYIRHNFEMDFWGVSYKQALEYILQNDQSPKIKIAATDYAYLYNFYMLSPEESNRIEIVKDTITNADYFITNYRWHHQDYSELNANEVYSIEICGSKINSVLKIQH